MFRRRSRSLQSEKYALSCHVMASSKQTRTVFALSHNPAAVKDWKATSGNIIFVDNSGAGTGLCRRLLRSLRRWRFGGEGRFSRSLSGRDESGGVDYGKPPLPLLSRLWNSSKGLGHGLLTFKNLFHHLITHPSLLYKHTAHCTLHSRMETTTQHSCN